MVAIRIKTVVGKDRKLVVQLPDDIPPGDVDLVVRSSEAFHVETNPAREAVKAKLRAAGALVTQFDVPADATRLSVEERRRLGTLPADARSSLDLINEDRGDW